MRCFLPFAFCLLLSCVGQGGGLSADRTRDKTTDVDIEGRIAASLVSFEKRMNVQLDTKIQTKIGELRLSLNQNSGAFSGGGLYVTLVSLGALAVMGIFHWKASSKRDQWRTLFGALARRVENEHYGPLQEVGGVFAPTATRSAISNVKQAFSEESRILGLKKVADGELSRLGILSTHPGADASKLTSNS